MCVCEWWYLLSQSCLHWFTQMHNLKKSPVIFCNIKAVIWERAESLCSSGSSTWYWADCLLQQPPRGGLRESCDCHSDGRMCAINEHQWDGFIHNVTIFILNLFNITDIVCCLLYWCEWVRLSHSLFKICFKFSHHEELRWGSTHSFMHWYILPIVNWWSSVNWSSCPGNTPPFPVLGLWCKNV